MNLNQLIIQNNIIVAIEAVSRRDLLDQLIQPLVREKIVDNAELFADNLEEREDLVTTQVEHGVALPHARSVAVKRLGLSVGIARPPGFNFGPDPRYPCQLFFLIAIPIFAPTAHLPLLRKLAAFAHNRKCRENMLSSNTPKQVIKHLMAFKG